MEAVPSFLLPHLSLSPLTGRRTGRSVHSLKLRRTQRQEGEGVHKWPSAQDQGAASPATHSPPESNARSPLPEIIY